MSLRAVTVPAMTPDAGSFPGPAPLGRGLVVLPDTAVPAAFDDVPRYVLDAEALAHPGPLAQALHHHWARRQPFVVALAVDNDELRDAETTTRPPWELGAWFGLERERLAHRVWANSWDLRGRTPVWWRGVVATRHTPLTPAPPGAAGDVVLPDGRLAWVDGGPRGPVEGVDAPLVHRESVELLRARGHTPGGTGAVRDDLDPEQAAVVAHPRPMARVLAPAGSGKTRVLVARLRHLLEVRGIEPELVTAVAYNRRAAEEVTERVAEPRLHVRTVHALAYAICRDAGITRVLDERDVRGVLDDLVSVARIPNTDPYQPWLEALAEVRLELRDPAEVEASRDDVPDFAAVFPRYRAELARRGAVDFDEQLTRAIELLCTDPRLRAAWRARCTHLLVDELQDVTPAFVLLLRLLAWPDLQVLGVGDDDQVIYGHAGADPAFLLGYDLLVPGAADLRLATNYRCPPDVVGAADTLLGHNRRRAAKRIHAAPGRDDAGLRVLRLPSAALADAVRDTVADRLAAGAAPTDVAVLSRVNAALLPYQVTLHEAGIATTAPLSPDVLRRTGIRAALAYLRIATDPERVRREDLHETLNRPSRQLRSALSPHLRSTGTWTLGRLGDLGAALTESQAERLEAYVSDLWHLATLADDDAETAALLRAIGEDVGLGEAMSLLDASGRGPTGSAHTDDLAALEQLAVHHPTPAGFDRWLREVLRQPGAADGVTLSSVHRVKGLEWDHVVVAPVVDGLVPHRLAEDTEEERRVLHVAITRGRRSVTVLVDRDRPGAFADELHEPADDPGGDEHGDLDHLADLPAPDQPDQARVVDGAVVAVPGLRLGLPGGAACVLDEVDDHVAVARFLRHGTPIGARLRLALRGHPQLDPTPVELAGEQRLLCPEPRRQPTRPDRSRGQQRLLDGDAPTFDERLAAARPDVTEVYEALRTWRRGRASGDGVPAYVVFDNKTLLHIAERDPDAPQRLLEVPGVGPTKLERYGDEVLELLADHR